MTDVKASIFALQEWAIGLTALIYPRDSLIS